MVSEGVPRNPRIFRTERGARGIVERVQNVDGSALGGDEFSEDEADDGRAHAIVERGGDQAEEGAEFYAANPTLEGFGETAQQHRN